MKRLLPVLVALLMVLSFIPASAEYEGLWQDTLYEEGPFAPMKEKVTLRVCRGYDESLRPGYTPETMYLNDEVLHYLNIEFDWMWAVPGDQFETKLSISLASGDIPHVLNTGRETMSYLMEANALVPLNDAYDQFASEPIKRMFESVDNQPLNACMYDGKLMAIPYSEHPAHHAKILIYRSDWMENLNLEYPTSLDEFTAILKAFRDDDPDGNGEKDTYGLTMTSKPFGHTPGYYPVFEAFDAHPDTWIEKNGEIVSGTIQPETKEALDYLRGLYAEGYINPEFATLDDAQLRTLLADSKVGIVGGWWWLPDAGLLTGAVENVETATWQAKPMVGLESGSYAKAVIPELMTSNWNVVTTAAPPEAPEAMMKLYNYFFDRMVDRTPVEEGGSGYTFYNHLDLLERQEMDKKWYAYWLPIVSWRIDMNVVQFHEWRDLYTDEIYGRNITPNDTARENNERTYIDWHRDRPDGSDPKELKDWIDHYINKVRNVGTANLDGTYGTAYWLVNEGHYVYNVDYGSETETGTAVGSTIRDMVEEYFNRYIMGDVTEDSWDEFVANWNALGGEQWTAEVNAAYAELH